MFDLVSPYGKKLRRSNSCLCKVATEALKPEQA